jgi:hypothetical protein
LKYPALSFLTTRNAVCGNGSLYLLREHDRITRSGEMDKEKIWRNEHGVIVHGADIESRLHQGMNRGLNLGGQKCKLTCHRSTTASAARGRLDIDLGERGQLWRYLCARTA